MDAVSPRPRCLCRRSSTRAEMTGVNLEREIRLKEAGESHREIKYGIKVMRLIRSRDHGTETISANRRSG